MYISGLKKEPGEQSSLSPIVYVHALGAVHMDIYEAFNKTSNRSSAKCTDAIKVLLNKQNLNTSG